MPLMVNGEIYLYFTDKQKVHIICIVNNQYKQI